jgi:UDP-2-acetamido-2,6-beta-L-arabino-hexul-4-ose reductase
MRIVVTGSEGFVGRNLRVRLQELGHTDVFGLSRATADEDIRPALREAEFVFHLAGTNRPRDEREFWSGNVQLTELICGALLEAERAAPIVYASSIQAAYDNPYGRSKAGAETAIAAYGQAARARTHNLRLHNIFGKWSRPDYNSVVSTFCHNIARDLPIRIDNPDAALSLVYIDDVVAAMTAFLESAPAGDAAMRAMPVYQTTVGALAAAIRAFRDGRDTLLIGRVGAGFERALYATYVSYLPTDRFGYDLPKYIDARGEFVEMLKTCDSGQFSYFTAHPGVTRGGHYHHSKTEKFLVIRGQARFRFRHIVTREQYELYTKADSPQIVESVPGWAHDITNVGHDEMIVMLWANEVFDRDRPDTFKHVV